MPEALIYNQLEQLNSKQFKDLTFKPDNNFEFSKNQNAVPALINEFPRASSWYPIVFVKDANKMFIPMILLSLRQDGHDLLTPEGQWQEGYVPAFLRRYPFITDTQNRIFFDKSAPHFNVQGDPLFNDKGELAEKFQPISNFLAEYRQTEGQTGHFSKTLADKKLLKKVDVPVQVAGRPFQTENLYMVDEKKLQELDDTTLAAWARNGILSLAYAHLLSLNSFARLSNLHTQYLIKQGVLKSKTAPEAEKETSTI